MVIFFVKGRFGNIPPAKHELTLAHRIHIESVGCLGSQLSNKLQFLQDPVLSSNGLSRSHSTPNLDYNDKPN